MTTLRDLLKRIRQWDALDIPNSDGAFWKREIDAALEQPEQAEPVAWMYVGLTVTNNMHGPHLVWKPEQMDAMSAEKGVVASPLYTHPPRREWRSLSEEEIESLWRKWVGTQRPNYSFTRAVEAALRS
jgi:hypothetical protein